MKSYYILFSNKGQNVCGCWKRADNKEDAKLQAEFALISHYSNVEYDNITVVNERC